MRPTLSNFVLMALALVGSVVAQALQGAMPDLIKRAESGDQEAQFQIGRAYQDGVGIEKNDSLALGWYRKAAEQGHSRAQNSLGFMYRQGKGVTIDKKEAVRWYLKSALQCDPNGAYNLAISSYNGDGLDADPGLAFYWFLVAKQCGNPETKAALDQIATEMRDGQREIAETKFIKYMFSTPDFKPDVDQMLTAMQTIDPSITVEICRAYAAKSAKRRDPTKARGWCEKALSLDQDEAYLVLGGLAEETNDFSKAAALYEKALEAEDFSAAGRLGVLYLDGKGVQQNPAQAYFWLYLATHVFEGEMSFESEFDRASLQLPANEKKEQEKRARNWAADRN